MHTFGSAAHLVATDLTQYEGMNYLLQWQICYDGDNWIDIENETNIDYERYNLSFFIYKYNAIIKIGE